MIHEPFGLGSVTKIHSHTLCIEIPLGEIEEVLSDVKVLVDEGETALDQAQLRVMEEALSQPLEEGRQAWRSGLVPGLREEFLQLGSAVPSGPQSQGSRGPGQAEWGEDHVAIILQGDLT